MRADPIDRLLVGFLLALAGVALLFVPDPWPIVAVLAAMLGSIVAAAWLRVAFPRLEPVHAFLPVPILAWLVNVVGPIVQHANPVRWDATLARIDGGLLAPIALAWKDAGGRPDAGSCSRAPARRSRRWSPGSSSPPSTSPSTTSPTSSAESCWRRP